MELIKNMIRKATEGDRNLSVVSSRWGALTLRDGDGNYYEVTFRKKGKPYEEMTEAEQLRYALAYTE